MRDNPQFNASVAGLTALGRVGLPDDIGALAAAMLSEDFRWVNGQRIALIASSRLILRSVNR